MIEEGPRTRKRITASTLQPYTVYGKRYVGNVPSDPFRSVSISASGTWSNWSEERIMDDVVVKNYKARSAAGEVIVNPLRVLVTTITPPSPCHFSRSLVYNELVKGVLCRKGDVWNGDYPMTSSQLGSFLDPTMYPEIASTTLTLKDQSVAKAHANASQAEISALMLAGEGRETVKSIASILMRAFKILLAIKRLDVGYLGKQLSPDEIADRYMEARYALRPMMYDVEGILKAWQTTVPNLTRRSTSRGFTAREWTFKQTVDSHDTSFMCKFSIEKELHCSAAVRSGVLSDVDVSHLTIWGVDTVFETALELIPFSFIANWFFNIADTLASWTPKAGVRKLASWATVTTVAVSVNKLVNVSNTWPIALVEDEITWGGSKSISVLEKTRHVDPRRSHFPSFDLNIDTLKLIDLTKIISQLRS